MGRRWAAGEVVLLRLFPNEASSTSLLQSYTETLPSATGPNFVLAYTRATVLKSAVVRFATVS